MVGTSSLLGSAVLTGSADVIEIVGAGAATATGAGSGTGTVLVLDARATAGTGADGREVAG